MTINLTDDVFKSLRLKAILNDLVFVPIKTFNAVKRCAILKQIIKL